MRILMMLVCLTTVALAQSPQITVQDIMFRADDYDVQYENENPYLQPTLRISSLIRNTGKTTAKNLKVRMTWLDLEGKQVRQEVEDLPEIKAGKEFLYWAPEFINPGRQFMQARVEVLDGDTVIASRSEKE